MSANTIIKQDPKVVNTFALIYNQAMDRRTQIIRIFQAIELSNVFFVLWLAWKSLTNIDFLGESYGIGILYGKIAFWLLSITLTPGILKRFGILPFVIRTIMPYRRHLGISTYLSIASHFTLVAITPSIATKTLPFITQFTFFGFIAFVCLTPLFLTSNDYSVRLLRRNWARLHKLVYLAALFVLFHLALQKSSLTIFAWILISIEVLSFIVSYARSRRNNMPPPAPPQISNS